MAVCIAARLRSTDRKPQRPKEEEEESQASSKFCRRREELEWKVAAMFAMTEYLGDIGRLA